MDTIGKLIKKRGEFSTERGAAKKLPAHHFQQVALDYIKGLGTDSTDKGRIFGAVRRNAHAAAAAFDETMRAKDVDNPTTYFLDLFNRAAGSSKKAA